MTALLNSILPDLSPTLSYIGPGAGIAILGSFLTVLVGILSAFFALFTWPVRTAWRWFRGRQARRSAIVKRVVILGLDGLEPELVERFLEEGALPNLAALRDEGTYRRLGTTWPPLSPVAWSSFSTGSNPGKHAIFDFLERDPDTYGPRISSVRIDPPRRHLRLGPIRVPLSRPRIENLRRSKPFWKVLSDAGVFSAVLRVPITFPPDKFHGVQLSAMCVPDLRGTQGTFFYFTEEGDEGLTSDGELGGERVRVRREGNAVKGVLPGPQNPSRKDPSPVTLPFSIVPDGKNGSAVLRLDRQKIPLAPGEFTDWVRVRFRLNLLAKASAVCRFYLKRLEPPFELYCTPLHIDPARPAMPISHPRSYSVYLAKQFGPYATLGLAEDTWSLSEGLMSEDSFLRQAYDIDDERQRMFFDAMRRVRRGLVTCVFDAPDRIQHMFWRHQDGNGNGAAANQGDAHEDTIREMYIRMDELVGKTRRMLGDRDALLVMSDHGFKTFRRGVDLNAWLLTNGYLRLVDGKTSSRKAYLEEVDWEHTRAYALGLAGIYINERGREASGRVDPGEEKERLVAEICEKLSGLEDADEGVEAVREAVPREKVYRGPYVGEAPDIIMGYRAGYRVAWDASVGKCGTEVFSDNRKAWSGDHCMHPDAVPGVLFSNIAIPEETSPNIVDLGPTALKLLGVERPAYMDGKSLV